MIDHWVTLKDGDRVNTFWLAKLLEKRARSLNVKPVSGDRLRSCQQCGHDTVTECHHVVPIRVMVQLFFESVAEDSDSFQAFWDAIHVVYEDKQHALYSTINSDQNKMNVCYTCHIILEREARKHWGLYKKNRHLQNSESRAYLYRVFKALTKCL